jgi:multidrug efflux pump subunit AcrA (membrane-fusion protein)
MAAMLGLKRRKRRHSNPRTVLWMIAILLWIGAGALSSCGGKSSFATPGTYTIPITLTVSGGSTQSINATVVVE